MKKSAILFGVALLLSSCTNNKPLPNGYDLLDRDNKLGLMPAVTLNPVRVARYWKTPPTGGHATLLLGESQNIQSSILLKCRNLIKIDSSAQVLAANLKMYGNYLFGQDSLFNVSIHRVQQEWDELDVLWDDIKDGYDLEPLDRTEFGFSAGEWNSIPISNLEFMQEWIKDSYQSERTIQGILLKCEQPTAAAEFSSVDATLTPAYIQIVTQNAEGGNDTTNAYLSHDASLLQYSSDVDPETLEESPTTLRVGNASGYKSLLKFDLSAIPSQATIHKALLTFYVDAGQSKTKSDGALTISAFPVVDDSTWAPETIAVDSTASAATDDASAENETFAFDSITPVNNMSRIVQKWVSDVKPNFGLMLIPRYPGRDFQEMSFMAGVSDTLLAPTLVITYSLPPSHRFARH